MMTEQLWKAMREGLKSQFDQSQWHIGKWRKLKEVKELCAGFNASPRIIDAMQYVNMELLAKVEVRGQIIKGDDKSTASQMRVIEAWHWPKEESVRLSIFAAELVLPNFEKVYPFDDRPRKAIEAARAWLENPTSAWSAARSAESARSAAESAWSAASAAWSAWSAASATWSAWSAWSAASAEWSAWSAASAAWSAAKQSILNQIEAYIQLRIPFLKPYVETDPVLRVEG
jgi:hypothetical protein